jgi:hypothetical protein
MIRFQKKIEPSTCMEYRSEAVDSYGQWMFAEKPMRQLRKNTEIKELMMPNVSSQRTQMVGGIVALQKTTD